MSVDANLERFAITVSDFSKASACELGEAPHVPSQIEAFAVAGRPSESRRSSRRDPCNARS